jgi:hypothetical protein
LILRSVLLNVFAVGTSPRKEEDEVWSLDKLDDLTLPEPRLEFRDVLPYRGGDGREPRDYVVSLFRHHVGFLQLWYNSYGGCLPVSLSETTASYEKT